MELAGRLANSGDLDELRARADAGDGDAGMCLAGPLVMMRARHMDVEELRALADAGDGKAAEHLIGLLAERGDLDQVEQIWRARADAGDGDAHRLGELLVRRGLGEEAERLYRFGLNLDGSIACG